MIEFPDFAMIGKSLIQSADVTTAKTPVKNREQWLQTARSTTTKNSSIFDKYFPEDDEEGNASDEAVSTIDKHDVRVRKSGKPMFLKKPVGRTDYSKPGDQTTKQLRK